MIMMLYKLKEHKNIKIREEEKIEINVEKRRKRKECKNGFKK